MDYGLLCAVQVFEYLAVIASVAGLLLLVCCSAPEFWPGYMGLGIGYWSSLLCGAGRRPYRSLTAVIGCPSQLTCLHCSGAGIGQLRHYKRWDAARQGMPFMYRRPLPMPSFMHALLLCVCFFPCSSFLLFSAF
jgi:hypothetical protein